MAGLIGTLNAQSWNVVQAGLRLGHRSKLPRVDARDTAILSSMQQHGGCATTLEKLDIDGTSGMMIAADRLMQELKLVPKGTGVKSFTIPAQPGVIIKYPEIIRWGLDERLLAIAEHYFGMPVAYRGVLARLDYPDGVVDETRLWHLDPEDRRIMKIVVYVSDVDADAGPFEFIPTSAKAPTHMAHGPKLRVSDTAALEARVPTGQRNAVIGGRGTVGFADTCSTLHRGRPPLHGHRQTLWFAYNCQYPFDPASCPPMFPVEQFVGVAGPLSKRQQAAITYRYLS